MLKVYTFHWVFFVFILCAEVGISSTDHIYLGFFIYIYVATIIILSTYTRAVSYFNSTKNILPLKLRSIDLIPATFIFVWFYGLIVGLASGNDIVAITRNFAGMVLYSSYFILRMSNLSSRFYISIFVVSTFVNIVIPIAAIVASGGEVKYSVDEVGLMAFRFYFSPSQSVLLPAYALSLCAIFIRPRRDLSASLTLWHLFRGWRKYLTLVLCVVAGPIASVSKGLILAFSIASTFTILAVLTRRFSRYKEVRRSIRTAILVVLLFVLIVGVVSLITSDFGRVLMDAFSSEHEGNSLRNEQRIELLGDINFYGHGLGAALSSGYSRDGLGYGFELSFENVIHKFGIASIFIFAAYVASFWHFFKAIFIPRLFVAGVAGFSGMLYLVPAAGNPTLFAPVCVALHISLLLFLQAENLDRSCILPTKD